MTENNMQDFDRWLKEVDNQFLEEFGLSYLDFPDCDWFSYFEDEMTSRQAFLDYCEDQEIEL